MNHNALNFDGYKNPRFSSALRDVVDISAYIQHEHAKTCLDYEEETDTFTYIICPDESYRTVINTWLEFDFQNDIYDYDDETDEYYFSRNYDGDAASLLVVVK